MPDTEKQLTMARSFWPNDCEGAVSLSFDDASPTHREIAIPLLDRYGLHGTFYVPTGSPGWLDHIPFWRDAAGRGHEVGNHSVEHPCSQNFDFMPRKKAIEQYTLERYEAEVLQATKHIQDAIPEQGALSYCYPCYHSWIGSGATRESIVPIIARHFPAGRGSGERPNHPEYCELEYLWACEASGFSGEHLIGYVEDAAAQGRWAVFCFHGVGGDHISVNLDAFETLLQHLSEQRQRLWIGTVVEVAIRIIDKRARPGG